MDRCTEFLNCISIRESVARFGLWYLFRGLALKRPKGEILRYLFRIKVLLGGSLEIFRQVTPCFLYASSPGKRTLRQVQTVDNFTLGEERASNLS